MYKYTYMFFLNITLEENTLLISFKYYLVVMNNDVSQLPVEFVT